MAFPRVLYEESDFAVIFKPAGMLVHAVPHTWHAPPMHTYGGAELRGIKRDTLADWIVKKYPETKAVGDAPDIRPGIVHRLDRDTSGIMLVAKTQAGFEYLKSLFQKREIIKTYLALVRGHLVPKNGRIDVPIRLKRGTTKRTIHKGKMEKEAVTDYKVLRYIGCEDNYKKNNKEGRCASLVEVRPQTGRTHQIRVHFASHGYPIVGDKIYGQSTEHKEQMRTGASRLMLHALSLEFTSSSGKRIKVEAEPPEEFMSCLDEI